ncbi:MAG: restriction endonuclease subunit S, partial [Planctomycetota bacterium]
APMKDSGIPWIGEIPAHWTLQPIKRFVRFHNNRRIPLSGEERADLEKVYDYYGASGVIDKVDRYLFDHDHILIGEDGANLLSRSSPLAFVAKGKYWVNNHAHILEPIGGQLSFWAERLECFSYAPFVTGAAQPKLTIEALGGIPISAPDISEQAEIGFYTESVNAIFGPKAETIALSITKLTEYRQSLISAAVTGQLPLPEETA